MEEKEMYEKLGKNIRKFRTEKGFSQEYLSELVEANLAFVGHVERFERRISLNKLLKIANVLEISLGDLFDF